MYDKGFSLIEMVVVLVLLGIGGIFATMFLVRGVQGYLFFSDVLSQSMKVQVALERIDLEWRTVNAVGAWETSRVQYTCDTDSGYSAKYSGTRELSIESGNIYLETSEGKNIILDKVQNGSINYNNSNEILSLSFTRDLDGSDYEYDIVVYPRY